MRSGCDASPGFYMNEDPEAKNYDAKLKIIPSLFNGSKGAKLTTNTQEDWNGRLLPGTKPSTRFLKATNILGDHPLNLAVDQPRVSRLPGDAGSQIQDLAARICRCMEGADCRKRRQHPVEHRTERPDWRRMGRQVVRRCVRMEFAGRGRAELRSAWTAGSIRQRVAAHRRSGIHAGAAAAGR